MIINRSIKQHRKNATIFIDKGLLQIGEDMVISMNLKRQLKILMVLNRPIQTFNHFAEINL